MYLLYYLEVFKIVDDLNYIICDACFDQSEFFHKVLFLKNFRRRCC